MNEDSPTPDEIEREIESLKQQAAALAAPAVDPSPATCGNCVSFRPGRFVSKCWYWPISLPVRAASTCAQHRRAINPALLDTVVDAVVLKFSDKTINVLRRNKLRTIEDVLDSGRSAVLTNGAIDRNAVREISAKLREFGIVW
ncbi:MAG: hypothetical protein DCC68_16720 [Planctomycetota bacterium]|nr:MAG: hypothetical protein DCC68_16720 [Planctomycetota bacterium]